MRTSTAGAQNRGGPRWGEHCGVSTVGKGSAEPASKMPGGCGKKIGGEKIDGEKIDGESRKGEHKVRPYRLLFNGGAVSIGS